MIGQLLDGRYFVTQRLGSGGFGETYLAEDVKRPGKPVCVLKHLKPASSDPGYVAVARRLFQTEAESLEKLGKHDRIPRLLAYFEEQQEFYLVQELIEGNVLTKELASKLPWREERVVALLADVLQTLAYIHQQGVIHRDIKPDNIIRRSPDQRLVLVDFGTVKQILTVRAQISTIIITGTPGYMPSEQACGKPRPNSDIYSLGILAVQALTGLHPSKLQGDAETGELVWQPWANCSRTLATIVSHMVRYHFRERYQSAEAVLAELEPLIKRYAQPSIARSVLPTRPPFSTAAPNPPDPHSAPTDSASTHSTSPAIATQTAIAAPSAALAIATSASSRSASPTNGATNGITNGATSGATSGVTNGATSGVTNGAKTPQASTAMAGSSAGSLAGSSGRNRASKSAIAATLPTPPIQIGSARPAPTHRPLRQLRLVLVSISSAAVLSILGIIGSNYWQQYQQAEQTIRAATLKYEDGKLNEAIKTASSIAASNFNHDRAQGLIARWKREWNANQTSFNQAEDAIWRGNWREALDQTNRITNRYWAQKAKPLIQQAKDGIAATYYPNSSLPDSAPISLPPPRSFLAPLPNSNEPFEIPDPPWSFGGVAEPKVEPSPQVSPTPEAAPAPPTAPAPEVAPAPEASPAPVPDQPSSSTELLQPTS